MIGVGDLVVCVDDVFENVDTGDWPARHPVRRHTYRVADAGTYAFMPWISLPEFGPDRWDARHFRPLNDSHDDAETIARIKNCQPSELAERASLKLASFNQGRAA